MVPLLRRQLLRLSARLRRQRLLLRNGRHVHVAVCGTLCRSPAAAVAARNAGANTARRVRQLPTIRHRQQHQLLPLLCKRLLRTARHVPRRGILHIDLLDDSAMCRRGDVDHDVKSHDDDDDDDNEANDDDNNNQDVTDDNNDHNDKWNDIFTGDDNRSDNNTIGCDDSDRHQSNNANDNDDNDDHSNADDDCSTDDYDHSNADDDDDIDDCSTDCSTDDDDDDDDDDTATDNDRVHNFVEHGQP
jgi:hypothetical protein